VRVRLPLLDFAQEQMTEDKKDRIGQSSGADTVDGAAPVENAQCRSGYGWQCMRKV
jgi:hypothetical protein